MQPITNPARLLKAPLFAVSDEWEHNGYNDSDFYRAMFDWHTGELKKVETHSTRYGCGYFAVVTKEYAKRNKLFGYINHAYNPATGQYDLENGIQVGLPVSNFVDPKQAPAIVLDLAEKALADQIFRLLRYSEENQIMKPQDAKRGDTLRLTEAHNSRKTGQKLPVGTVIRVNDCEAFGTFYRNGYNHPSRSNRSVIGTVLGHPETLVRVPLAKCRLDRELTSDSELRQRAAELAHNRRFEQTWGRVY